MKRKATRRKGPVSLSKTVKQAMILGATHVMLKQLGVEQPLFHQPIVIQVMPPKKKKSKIFTYMKRIKKRLFIKQVKK